MMKFFPSLNREDKATVLNFLRSQTDATLAHAKLRSYPQFINEALKDPAILQAIGGQTGVRTFALMGLEVSRAIIQSDAFKSFDESIKDEIRKTNALNSSQKLHQAAKKN